MRTLVIIDELIDIIASQSLKLFQTEYLLNQQVHNHSYHKVTSNQPCYRFILVVLLLLSASSKRG
jgi:hypothetical protein